MLELEEVESQPELRETAQRAARAEWNMRNHRPS
jgi:hypothetical protein